MRKSVGVLTIAALLMMAGAAFAAQSTVPVSATVVGTCQFSEDGLIEFMLDPQSGADVSATITQPKFWCTNGATWTMIDNDGDPAHGGSGTTHRLANADHSAYIEYSFDYTASGTGSGPTTPITMNITSTVVGTEYISAPAGAYHDIVTLTVLP